ncbi:hypothetical protein LCGC14_1620530 [marine sediment metagenome]|uniref:Uncharacterized protein n=1 Tax=marine sediment metagenome TaxID=412755 RepID=A0A0F9KL59_9ZZZZ
MSYLTDNGISMASDSNITLKNNFEVIENRPYIKTKYFKAESIGVSVWGELFIKKLDFWNWFEQEMKKFLQTNSSKSKFAVHLANELNDIITFENKRINRKITNSS